MDLSTLQRAISNLGRSGVTVRERQCQDPSAVHSTQQILGFEFPHSVRQFYAYYEFLQIGPYEFVWIRTLPDLVAKLRARFGIPTNYLPVLPDGMGGYYYVVCAEKNRPNPENIGAVVYSPSGRSDSVEFRYSDFFDLILSCIAIAQSEE
jgi:hypothetical protein